MSIVPRLVQNSGLGKLGQYVWLYTKREKPKEYLNYPPLSLIYIYATSVNQTSHKELPRNKHMDKINGYTVQGLNTVDLIL